MLGDRGYAAGNSPLDGLKSYPYSANLTADFLHKQPILLILWQPGRELPNPLTTADNENNLTTVSFEIISSLIKPIPDLFPTPIAAKLLGVSVPTFDAIGIPPWQFSRRHKRYTKDMLETFLGREITAEMVAAARAAHAPKLALYQAANAQRKAQQHAR